MSHHSMKRFYNMRKEEETAPSIKRRKTENPDWLSNLPDEVIVSILSLLTAKEAAQTCILSKRWPNLWVHVPSLCFDISDFNGEVKRFKDFVNNFLLQRDETIDIHNLRILMQLEGLQPSESLDPVGGEWIKYAVKHNLRTLELSFTGCCRLDIPDCLFTCKTLEDVKLNLQGLPKQEIKPSVVYLPRLRKLDMTGVKFRDDNNLEKIIVGCPVLEDLRMEDCCLDLAGFSCHTVKQLQLLGPATYYKTVSISVPCVQTL